MTFSSIDDLCERTPRFPLIIASEDIQNGIPWLHRYILGLSRKSHKERHGVFLEGDLIIFVGDVTPCRDGYVAAINYASRVKQISSTLPSS